MCDQERVSVSHRVTRHGSQDSRRSEAPMKEPKEYRCPSCKKSLSRKPIQYGLPDPDADLSDVISGGCCVDEHGPKFGYECPKCHKTYLVKQGQLLPFGEEGDENEEEDDGGEDEGADENKKIDDDMVNLEMLDFFEDDL